MLQAQLFTSDLAQYCHQFWTQPDKTTPYIHLNSTLNMSNIQILPKDKVIIYIFLKSEDDYFWMC